VPIFSGHPVVTRRQSRRASSSESASIDRTNDRRLFARSIDVRCFYPRSLHGPFAMLHVAAYTWTAGAATVLGTVSTRQVAHCRSSSSSSLSAFLIDCVEHHAPDLVASQLPAGPPPDIASGASTTCHGRFYTLFCDVLIFVTASLGPFHGAIAVPCVTRCLCLRRRRCCRRRYGHRCAGGVRQYSGDTW